MSLSSSLLLLLLLLMSLRNVVEWLLPFPSVYICNYVCAVYECVGRKDNESELFERPTTVARAGKIKNDDNKNGCDGTQYIFAHIHIDVMYVCVSFSLR